MEAFINSIPKVKDISAQAIYFNYLGAVLRPAYQVGRWLDGRLKCEGSL
jgi:hypothetical protein